MKRRNELHHNNLVHHEKINFCHAVLKFWYFCTDASPIGITIIGKWRWNIKCLTILNLRHTFQTTVYMFIIWRLFKHERIFPFCNEWRVGWPAVCNSTRACPKIMRICLSVHIYKPQWYVYRELHYVSCVFYKFTLGAILKLY